MSLRQQILTLKQAGKSYRQIEKELGCSKGTIAYHCNSTTKLKSTINRINWRRDNPLSKKIHTFCYLGSYKRKLYKIKPKRPKNLTNENLLKKFGEHPVCYITGESINLNNSNEYSLDHIIPLVKGGQCTLNNCGLTTFKANQMKNGMSYEELVHMCRLVVNQYDKVWASQNSNL